MKLLSDILYNIRLGQVLGSTNVEISNITFDSRSVSQGFLFIAVRGFQVDGHEYIQQAIDKGATAIVYEHEIKVSASEKYTLVKVANSSEALAIAAGNFYDNPSAKLVLIGVTGTNGKTSVATLCYRLFKSLGYKCGLLSTVQNEIDGEVIQSTHTTPDAIQINALLLHMLEQGCTHCFMEASSHAIHQDRVRGLDFNVTVFTNITHDHLDYHKTFDNYIAAKKKLFDNLPSHATAIVNIDDKRGMVMVQNTKAKIKTFSLKSLSDYKAIVLENTFSGLVLNIDGQELYTQLVGEFNAYNILAVYAVAITLGIDNIEALAAISKLKSAEGRFDYTVTTNEKIIAIVDYAHTPDALKNVLKTINAIRTNNEKLTTVIGCGGNRDKEKRPEMAAIACEYSNQVILTSDNPRKEKAEDIIEDMRKGIEALYFKKVLSITDRKEAIKTACALANKKDIILLAGKGHEKYQEINGVKYDFDDKAILLETLKQLEK